jgi:ribosome-binding factor A
MSTINKSDKNEGFLVFQDPVGPGHLQVKFYEKLEEAETAARTLLGHNMRVYVVPGVRFTTENIEKQFYQDIGVVSE